MQKFTSTSVLAPVLTGVLSALLLVPSAQAEIHSWRDKDGNLHFGDEPPAQGAEVRVVELSRGNDYTNVELPVTTASSLVMYSASWCGYCKKARRYFNTNGIAFREYDIEKNPSAKRAYDRLRISGVPVIVQDGRTMRGFSADQVVDVVDKIIDTYLEERKDGEEFIDTYRRVGQEPFKERVYGTA